MASLGPPAEPARATYVRICPVCDAVNPPERTRCACGASLAGVDFTLQIPPAPAEVAIAESASPETSAPAATPPAGSAPRAAAAPAGILCPYADCAQPNPVTARRCVYCNRPLHDESDVAGARPLPRALRDRYRTIEAFPATGSEADLLLVVDRESGDKVVAKLYRRGIEPDVRLLEVLANAVGDTVVRILDHGVSDGVAYEILEYVPGGTLEALMRRGPLPPSDIRCIVQQIGDALRGIHAQHILHRDLKPDNVLVRTASPLTLALTDFGIASFTAATQHFTSVARTTRYAAPEVLTGVLDAKSDWWSLGMIVLEAASGRHPFDGLSEQVMNYQLATRPIDVRGVFDDRLRLLCRGLLLRDPKRRFGDAEVARWLAGDATLEAGPDTDVPAAGIRPYRIGSATATTAAELAIALARHWDAARRDLTRGVVARWVEQELHDYNLLRTLRDVQDRRDLSDDGRLLRFLVAAAPDLPAIWRDSPVTVEAVQAAARAGAGGDAAAIDWLDSLVTDDVLASFATRVPALGQLAAAWAAAWERFAAGCERVRAAHDAAARRPRSVASDEVVDIDELMYAVSGRLELPPRSAVNAGLLMALADPAYVATLRGEVSAARGELAAYCPWFEAAFDEANDEVTAILVAAAVLPPAREAAAREKQRQAARAAARLRLRLAAQDELRGHVARVLALSPKVEEDLPSETLHELLRSFEAVQRACVSIERLDDPAPETERLRGFAARLASFAAQTQRALARIEEAQGTNAIFLTRERITWVVAAFGVALVLRQPILLIVLLVGVTLVVAYRWYGSFHVTETALKRLRTFGLHARTFLRSTDPVDAGAAPDGTRPGRPDPSARRRWWRRDAS